MKCTIDEEICRKYNLSLSEFLAALIVKSGANVKELYQELVNREVLVVVDNKYLITNRWDEICDKILLCSDNSIPKDNELIPLAERLMELFPKGKKEGTNNYWKGNKREIVLKLQKFYKLYGKYTAEEIYNATKAYIDYHKNNLSIMRTLKYFILKNEVIKGETSDLATWLENSNQETESVDWTSDLR